MKDPHDMLDSSVDVTATAKYRAARADVLRQLKALKRGDSMTHGRLSVLINQNVRDILNEVLLDLVADGIVSYDPKRPAPSLVTKR